MMGSFVENVNKLAADLTPDFVDGIQLVLYDSTSITTVGNSISSVITTAGSIDNVNTVSGSIDNVNDVVSYIANIDTVAGSIAGINSVATAIVPNIAEILLADDNAAIATTKAGIATTQAGLSATSADSSQLSAWRAEAEKMTADSYATEAEDVFVKIYTSNDDGTFTATNTTEYSALHWAAAAIAASTIDSVPTDGSTNAVSSNGVFDALALKSPLDSPAFTTAATIDGNNIATENYVASLGLSQMVLGTEVGVSGTAVDFTGIPSWVKRISMMFYLVSGSGTSDMIVQLGDSEGFETSGYVGDSYSSVHNLWSIGIVVNAPSVASGTMQGVVELLRVNTTKWVVSGIIDGGASYHLKVAGVKELSGVLDRIRLTTVNGTDTFDDGSVTFIYEG